MQKTGIIISIIGAIAIILGIAAKIKGNMAISIIGGVDGPTSVFIAGRVSDTPVIVGIVCGILLVVIGTFLLLKNRKS